MQVILKQGERAPDFTLRATDNRMISLSQMKGKLVILSFYPADWSPVCSSELVLYNEIIPEFKQNNADLFGISVDGYWCHKAFAEHYNFHFPLLSDFEPKGAVAKKYHVYQENEGICERALFLIDKNGMIAWSYLSPLDQNPGADRLLDAIESLQAGKS